MCRRVTCSTCNKPTFAGCGAHVEQVLGNVPVKDRCDCAQRKASAAAGAGAGDGKAAAPRSFWRRLTGQ